MKAKKSVQPEMKPKNNNKPFLAIVVLFAAFSMYALTSFFTSTNKYIDSMFASVVDGQVDLQELGLPLDCQTCPPNLAVCDPVCKDINSEEVSQESVDKIFNDVDVNSPNAEAIRQLYYAGVISGYADSSFKPDKPVNRAEIWTILTTAIDSDLSGDYSNCFTDVSSEWFAPFVCYAKSKNWITG